MVTYEQETEQSNNNNNNNDNVSESRVYKKIGRRVARVGPGF